MVKYSRSKLAKVADNLLQNVQINRNTWYSATSFRNSILNNHLVDWYKYTNPQSTGVSNSNETFGQTKMQYLFAQGNKFEENMKNNISKRVGLSNVASVVNSVDDIYNQEKYAETIQHIQRGTPIIFNGVLANPKNKTYGSPDIIIRSDYINRVMNTDQISSEDEAIPSNNGNYHYRIIDIKFATMRLSADGTHLLNQGMVPAYKTQIGVYNDALSIIQGYKSPLGYILGRGYTYTKSREVYSSNNALDALGVIDFEDRDSGYKTNIRNGIKWRKLLRKRGKTWSISPPSNEYLYPNMSAISSDYYVEKKALADQLDEITSIYGCGVKNRVIAFENGIRKWSDPRCNAKTLGVNGPKTSLLVNTMLKFNRSNSRNRILNKAPSLKQSDNSIDFYVTIEQITSTTDDFKSLPRKQSCNNIYLIGMAYTVNDKSYYTSWVTWDLTRESEANALTAWMNTMENICIENSIRSSRIMYWGRETASAINNALDQYEFMHNYRKLNLVNMQSELKSNMVLVKGVFGFNFVDIANKLSDYSIISDVSTKYNQFNNMINAKSFYDSESEQFTPAMEEIRIANKNRCSTMMKMAKALSE